MENVTAVTTFILMSYNETEDDKNVLFICFLILYIVILLLNSVLFLAIYTERGLHEPMYFFVCNLSVNGVYGSTVFLMSMLDHFLSQTYEISLTNCLIEIYSFYVYGTVEFTILAVMSYDRYVAICHPLHYHLLMSPREKYLHTYFNYPGFIPCVVHWTLFRYQSLYELTFCDTVK